VTVQGVLYEKFQLGYNSAMSHNALLEYVRKAKDIGADDAQIIERLHAAGWYRVDIQDALHLYHKLTQPAQPSHHETPLVPKPSLAERIAPHTYDSHLIAVAAVSFAVGFIAYLVLLK